MRLPGNTHRATIIGRTGSGKTQAAIWLLSTRDWKSRVWIIIDFKRDALINSLPNLQHIENWEVPTEPGIYAVHPLPTDEDEAALEEFLWEIWRRENIGVYIDEGYMMGNSRAFRALLTQGRSKHIPLITLTQRPVEVTRFVFSEAEFFMIFDLNDKRDRKTIQAFVPADLERRLPDYHSLWYDVGSNETVTLGPVPARSVLIERFRPIIVEPETPTPTLIPI